MSCAVPNTIKFDFNTATAADSDAVPTVAVPNKVKKWILHFVLHDGHYDTSSHITITLTSLLCIFTYVKMAYNALRTYILRKIIEENRIRRRVAESVLNF